MPRNNRSRLNLILGALCAVAVGLGLTTTSVEAIGAWNLGASFAQKWVQRVAPEVVAPVEKVVRSLINAPRPEQGGAGTGPSVTTDYKDYQPGDTVNITGSGFWANENVILQVLHTGGGVEGGAGHEPWVVVADENGGFTSSWYVGLDAFGKSFLLTAVGVTSGLKASTTFTDNIVVDFKQCANEDTTLGDCHWINSILQSSNARIYEGMSTLQRMIFDAIPASTNSGNYRLQFHTDSLKAASHAYDFITTWETAIDATDETAPAPLTQPVPLYPQELKLRTLAANQIACGEAIPDSGQPPTIKDICLALRASTNVNVIYASLDPVNVAGFDPVLGDDVSTRVSAYHNRYGLPLYGAGNEHRAVKIYANAPINNPTFTLLGYDGQGNAQWQLTWHAATGAVPTQVMIEFAAHVAVGDNKIPGFDAIEYGLGRGASNINGGPYHVSVDLFDFFLGPNTDDISLGSQDNQLKGADVLTPPAIPVLSSTLTGATLGGTVAVGGSVHDTADIDTGVATNLIPAGSTVTFQLFNNLTCTAPTLLNTYGPIAVPSGVQVAHVDSPSFVPTVGNYSYLVTFTSGNEAIVQSGVAPCEPFSIADANIQITPATAVNAVGTNHTLTISVNAVNGTIAAAGGTATASITSGPGSFVGSPSCNYAGGGASSNCTVVITSPTVGTTVVSATSNIPITGDGSITRTTDGTGSNSGPASKTWANATIAITPATAVNAVGTNHTLTITVNTAGTTITAGGGTATATIDSGPGSFVGSPSCNYAGGGATANCTVVITSATTGTTVVSASSNIPLNGDGSVTRTTNGSAGNSSPAQKTWADANIQITPATAVNAVSTNHTLTITVNTVGTTITAGGGTATASIVSGPGGFVGSPSCSYAGGAATANCTVVITSATTGTTVVSATSSIPLNGDGSVSRTTDGTGSNSDPAEKIWANANIQITPATAVNAVGTNHTLTITVNTVGTTITAGGGTATASITNGPGSFVGSPTCNYAGGAATANCTVVITSNATGTTLVSATSNIPLHGDGSVSRTTNGSAGNSSPASKAWADAKIAITPATATNPTGSTHTLTITVTSVGANIGAGSATASITNGPGSFVGSPTCAYPAGGLTSFCTVVITSAVTGVTTISATSNIPLVGAGSVTRTTDGSSTPSGLVNSNPAQKTWVNSSVATNVHNAAHVNITNTSVPLGTVVHDSATVDVGTGLTIPAGSTFTFHRFTNLTCTGASTDQAGVGVTGGAQTGTSESSTFTPAAGTYSYLVDFVSGNPSQAASKTGNPATDCEPFTLEKKTPTLTTDIHNAAHGIVLSVPLGSTVHDTATVGGLIVGFAHTQNITFTFFTTANNCTGASVAAGSVPTPAPTGGLADGSTAQGPLTAGPKSFQASLAGDANYNAVTSACEPLAVDKVTPTLTTDIHNAAHGVVLSVPLGSTVHDTATVGNLTVGVPHTQSITFTFFTAADNCTGASVAAGSVATPAPTGGLADGSTAQGPLTAGPKSFQASLAGDVNYNAVTSACEPLTVTKVTPTLTTDIHNAAHAIVTSVPLGTTVHDTATVGNLTMGVPHTQNITFTFFTTANNCTGTSVGAGSVATPAPTGGLADGSTAQGPLTSGAKSFQASLAADGNYNAVTSACEPLAVAKEPTRTVTTLHNGPTNDSAVPLVLPNGSSAKSNTVHDSAQVNTNNPAFGLTGNVTFRFYTTQASCTSDSAFVGGTTKGTVALVAGVAHPSDVATGLAAGNYAFRARYNGDVNYNASTSACEPFFVTTLTIIKNIHGPSATFSYDVTGANALAAPTTNITPPANGSGQFGPAVINTGNNTIREHTPLPAGYTMTDIECHGYTGGGTGPGPLVNGIPSSWNFTAANGNAVVCTFVNSALQTTRTQGFWSTHTALANNIWNGVPTGLQGQTPVGNDAVLCGVLITALPTTGENVLMGGFWSSISKLSNGAGRTAIDQKRMQMLQQYLAAVLNVHAFGSGSPVMLAAARAAYCSNDINAIQNQIGILGTFNESGDSQAFTPGASATPKVSKAQADIDAWDIPQYPELSDNHPQPTLALNKTVAPGGTAIASDFVLRATCVAGPCGSASIGPLAPPAGNVAATSIVEGTYTLTDVGFDVAGRNGSTYTPGNWVCNGPPAGGFAVGPTVNGTATLLITQGAVVTCTISNTP